MSDENSKLIQEHVARSERYVYASGNDGNIAAAHDDCKGKTMLDTIDYSLFPLVEENQETPVPLQRLWLIDPMNVAVAAIARLWEEKEFSGTPLMFQIQREQHLYHPELLDKTVQWGQKRKRVKAEQLIGWERLAAPSYAGEIGAIPLRDRLYESNLITRASIYDRKTVPGPYLSGWFAYKFNGWSALSVLLDAKDEDENIGIVIIPEGRQDDWLAFQGHLRQVLYSVLHKQHKSRIDILGSPEDGGGNIQEEVRHSTFEQVILPRELIESVLSQHSIFQPEILKRYEMLRVPRLRKVLLIGPPGTGKTTLVKAIAAEHVRNGGYVVYVFAESNEDRSWHRLQTALASAVRVSLPTLVVVEDLENFVSKEENMQTILNTLDGVATPDNKAGTLLLATTNAPEKIDRRITQRPGRIDVMIEISAIKDEEQAIRLLSRFLQTSYQPEEHNRIARRLVGQVGSHVREVCLLASIKTVEQGRDHVTLDDLIFAHDAILAGRKAAANLGTCEPPKAGGSNVGFAKKEHNELRKTSMREQQLQDPPETSVGLVNVAVHGHFYQPPREDPFTGIVPCEEGAAPYANFNERITAECYRPNAEAGNFDLISYDMGPTLAAWLQRAHKDVYDRIIEADRRHMERFGVGNALAQAYNHAILPLMSACDKRTQILWGLADFRHRYGHDAQGMWLPETAVNLKTLDILAESGVTYTILNPWQAASPIDITQPYRVRLPEDRSITVFFYNDVSGAVSYNDDRTADANQFAAEYQRVFLNHDRAKAGHAQITTIATDGELYGHHKAWRDKFLNHFLLRSASAYGLTPCSLGRYLATHPATQEVSICELSSWSCSHSVDRWRFGCSCTEGPSDWKEALYDAIAQLVLGGDGLFGYYGEQTLVDPWAARDDYLALRNGWEPAERFWARHSKPGHMDIAHIRAAQQLLEAQYWLQCARTSCGWFFEDLDRIEPCNDLAFARRAVSLFWLATGHDLQRGFVKDLEQARSWRTGRTGADLYRSLPTVPKSLLPPL